MHSGTGIVVVPAAPAAAMTRPGISSVRDPHATDTSSRPLVNDQ
jgi:hypothetical protein